MAKILVVDDNENILKLLTSVLSADGHITVCCKEPRDGLEKLQTEFFELVITDIMMPGGVSGFDFVKAVRSEPKFSGLPIIIVTGRREANDIEKGVMVGADDYVVKPIDPDVLRSKVTSLLKSKPRPENNFARGYTQAKAAWDVQTDIVQITEIGLEVESTLPVPLGLKLKLHSDFFGEIGIRPPILRVIHCTHQPDKNLYRVSLHFVGLSEKEMTPIRLWIRNSKVAKKTA